MESEREYISVRELLDLRKQQMLIANPEYQRGEVWKEPQKKKLIDSIMRGYPLPVVYLHHITQQAAGYTNTRLEIVDGQQRLNCIEAFHAGAFPLFHPIHDDAQARFPRFLQKQECPWGQHTFDSLPEELKKSFLEAKLPVAYISSKNSHEVRDLFVRLQGGLPLTPQEKRDALPGDFCDFVLKLGGKSGLVKYPGQPFFRLVSAPSQNRGGTRTLAAQIAMLFLTRREKGPDAFTDITSGEVDDYYHRYIDFDSSSSECQRLIKILHSLHNCLGDGKRPKLRAHLAIHLVLFADDVWDNYVPGGWQGGLAHAVDKFIAELASASKLANNFPTAPNRMWSGYGQWARTGSNSRVTIERRHRFFVEWMHETLEPYLLKKDSTRTFGDLDRQIIYYRDGKKCQICGNDVSWADVEVHHVIEHHLGGQTDLDNGALVHGDCHPKGEAAKAFAEKWKCTE